MSEIIEKDSTALAVIEPANIMTVFTDRQRIDPILERIAREVRSFVPDTSTAKGRKEIASMAFKVAQTKTYLDGLGKDLVAELKELPGRIDKNRAAIRETLDALKAEVRKPLTDWEAEQERIAAEEKAKAEAAALAAKVEADHELAILMDREIERQAAAAKAAAEQARIDREARIAAEAAERAKREAEERAAREQAEAARREAEARLAQERAEQAKRDAEARALKAEQDAKDQAERAAVAAELAKKAAAANAERAAREAEENERRRAAAQAEKERQDAEARAADEAHRKAITDDILFALNFEADLSDEAAAAVLAAILAGKIPHVSVVF